MATSFFNYPITRPYPYAWFTPVAVVGGICLLSLLSVLNFVQNSYVLTIQYANDPNSTISNGIWFQNWPSYITRTVRPTCEPANLPLNTQFFTNQSGLTWTLTSVFNNDSAAPVSPSLTYMNNVLEDCKVDEIQMDFDGTQDREVAVAEVTPWDVQIRAFATCGIWGATGYTLLNITAMYDPVQPFPVAGSSSFVATDPVRRASMYWAQALLSAYWVATANTITNVAIDIRPQEAPAKGVAMLYPTSNEAAITDPAFFNLQFNFLKADETEGWGYHGLLHPINVYINDMGAHLQTTPQIWAPVDQLSKSMYSAVLTDLGQISAPAQANIVTNATTIETFSASFEAIDEQTLLAFTQLELQSYDTRQASGSPTGSLGLSSSVIAAKYLCQVPHRKPIGDIFISVLLADLVLLQAAWKLYTFVVNRILMRKKGTVTFCEGCLQIKADEGKEELERVQSTKDLSKNTTLISTISRQLSAHGQELPTHRHHWITDNHGNSKNRQWNWRVSWLRR